MAMVGRSVVVALAAGVAGCAGSADPAPEVLVGGPSGPVDLVVEGGPAPVPVYEQRLHPGDAALSVVGTPFLVAFRSVVCVASVAVAAPVAAVAAVVPERPAQASARKSLGEGVASNCGPPWVISPYRWVRVEPVAVTPPAS